MAVVIGNKIELVSIEQVIKNEKNKKVYVSKVYDILQDNILQVAMPIYEGKIVPLELGGKFTACFYTDRGLLQSNVIVSSRYKSGNLFYLEITLLSEPEKVQRREFYRHNCLIDAKIRVVSDDEFTTGQLEDITLTEDDLSWKDAKILDLSGGGARIVQLDNMDRDEVIKLKFEASTPTDNFSFSLFARVLACTQLANKAGLYELRMEFMKIKQEERDKIVKYIFDTERLARAKELGH